MRKATCVSYAPFTCGQPQQGLAIVWGLALGEEARNGICAKLSRRVIERLGLTGLALLLSLQTAPASSAYTSQVPNGQVHRCATCHEKSGPPDLNKFGEAFFSANCKWTPALAAEDADQDGISNGRELGDAQGAWKAGAQPPHTSWQVSLPGDVHSKPRAMGHIEAFITPIANWLGHYHPVFVHLPIGGLLLIGVLEVLGSFPRFRRVTQHRSLILVFTLGGTFPAVICGWLLSQSGSYETDLMLWHKWTGVGLLAACLLTLVFNLNGKQRSYQVACCGTILLLLLASHYGGSLTHGRDFLTLQLPERPQASAPLEAGQTGGVGGFASFDATARE